MTILIIYSTNSGSTGEAVSVISSALSAKGHTVTIKQAYETTPTELSAFDFLVFGSPSWDYEGKEGQPLEDMTAFLSQLDGANLSGKKYAVFGLGDSSYTYFCGAVPIMESMLNAKRLVKTVDSLMVDRYYANPNTQSIVTGWVDSLTETL